MNEQVNQLVMNADFSKMSEGGLAPAAEQLHRKQRLAAALRIFGKFGFDEGVGHSEDEEHRARRGGDGLYLQHVHVKTKRRRKLITAACC